MTVRWLKLRIESQCNLHKMNYVGLSTFDTANGPGVRVSIFVAGCTLHCKGCFNPESWDFYAGHLFTDETLQKILSALDSDFIDGLSILGGDPLEKENIPEVTRICRTVKEKFGSKKTIWLWTGRRYEQMQDLPLFQYVDCVVDGPFVEKLKTTEKGKWYGSTNQRIIPLTVK